MLNTASREGPELGPHNQSCKDVTEVSMDSQWPSRVLYRVGWVSGAVPSRKMSGPLGFRIFLMADVFMRFSRRIRLKPLDTRGRAGEKCRLFQKGGRGMDEAVLTSYIG